MCGIYKIINKINNKIYIGQSINIELRWKRHLTLKDNMPIHLAIQKYGQQNFILEIIEICPQEELNAKEIYWINQYNSKVPNGYNISDGGKGGVPKSVQSFNEKGELVKEYSSISEASADTGVTIEKIIRSCKSSNIFAGEYQWKYTDDDSKIIKARSKRRSKKVYQFDSLGRLLKVYDSITIAAKENNIDKSCICACCNHRQKTSGGYQWSYEEFCPQLDLKGQKRQVAQYSLEGELIAIYPTITAAAQANKTTPGAIGAVCTGHSKTCKGHIFKYYFEELINTNIED